MVEFGVLEKWRRGRAERHAIPIEKPMRIIVLIKIAEQIDMDRKYTEKEINEIIRQNIAFTDIELIRREMFQYRLIGRLRDGSEYWAEKDWRSTYEEMIR